MSCNLSSFFLFFTLPSPLSSPMSTQPTPNSHNTERKMKREESSVFFKRIRGTIQKHQGPNGSPPTVLCSLPPPPPLWSCHLLSYSILRPQVLHLHFPQRPQQQKPLPHLPRIAASWMPDAQSPQASTNPNSPHQSLSWLTVHLTGEHTVTTAPSCSQLLSGESGFAIPGSEDRLCLEPEKSQSHRGPRQLAE